MTVLVDTSVWSLAYRRQSVVVANQLVVDEFQQLVRRHEAVMIGPVRQETLSGIPDAGVWQNLRSALRAFDDLLLLVEDYELAADCYNRCRAVGVQGSFTDFLICAVSQRYAASIFTIDRDFLNYANQLPIVLHRPELMTI